MDDFNDAAGPDVLGPPIRKMGIREAARRSGIQGQYICAWLKGKHTMPLVRRLHLAQTVGLVVRLEVRPPKKYKVGLSD